VDGRLIEFTFNPLPGGRVLAVGHDVTEVKYREEALRAASDILKLISDGRVDLTTVLNRLVESACKLCEADGANIFQRDGEVFRVTASHGYSPELTDFMKRQAVKPGRNSLSGRTVVERGVPAATIEGLKARGHQIVVAPTPWGGAQAIRIDWKRGVLIGGSEPRKDGMALGY